MTWQKGQSGNPKGRPPGSRQKLNVAYLEALAKDFVEHGPEVIAQVREEDPVAYMKAVGALVPRDHRLETFGEKIEFTVTERAARLAAILTAAGAGGDRPSPPGGSAKVVAISRATDGGAPESG